MLLFLLFVNNVKKKKKRLYLSVRLHVREYHHSDGLRRFDIYVDKCVA